MSGRWDERYRSSTAADRLPEPMITEVVPFLPPGDAVDLACGLGRHAVWLAERGWRVLAVDSSAIALASLQQRAPGLPIEVLKADLEDGSFRLPPDSFDLVVDSFFLWRPLWPEISAAVRQGGMFAGVFPTEAPQGRTFNPDYLIRPGELELAFEGWEVIWNRSAAGRQEFAALRPHISGNNTRS